MTQGWGERRILMVVGDEDCRGNWVGLFSGVSWRSDWDRIWGMALFKSWLSVPLLPEEVSGEYDKGSHHLRG